MSYLSEAFKAMNILEEDAFNLSNNQDDIDAIKDFTDNDVLDGQIDVIDPDAEDDTELEDSYIGKGVIECVVCHQKIYKDKADINIDEESGLVNVDEECPYCYSADGYRIVGQIDPYKEFDDIEEPIVEIDGETVEFDENGEATVQVEPDEDGNISVELVDPEPESDDLEDSEEDVDLEISDDKEDDDEEEKNEDLDESLIGDITGRDRVLDTVDNAVNAAGNVLSGANGADAIKTAGQLLADAKSEEEEMQESCEDKNCCDKDNCKNIEEGFEHVNVETADATLDMSQEENGKVTITSEPKEPHETGEEVIAPFDLDDAADVIEDSEDEILSDEDFDFDADEPVLDVDDADVEAQMNGEEPDLAAEEAVDGMEFGEEKPEEEEEPEEKKNESFHEEFEGSATRCVKGTNESCNEGAFSEEGPDFEETKKWEKETASDDKLTDEEKKSSWLHKNESCEEGEPCEEGLLGAAVGALGSLAAAHPVATALGAGALGGLAGSALSDSKNESCDDTESCEEELEEDIMIENIDENKFNELAEGYLKNVYENVESFNTINCYEDPINEALIIEGNINFNSGASRNVQFTFSPKYTKGNKYYFEGVCSKLAEGNGIVPFKMAATINEGFVTPRALKYHYTINESLVDGTVIK